MQASVIIPVWNGEAYLPECLEALLAQRGVQQEIIAVDNGSADGSAMQLGRHPEVRVLRFARNRGFAAACNAGAAAATGEILAFLNQDTRVEPGWLAALIAPLADPRVGVVGSKLLYGDGRRIQHAGGYLEPPHWYGRHYGSGDVDAGQWDEPREVQFVTGAAMAVRRAVFAGHEGFDPGFAPAYFEDADLCLRLARSGLRVQYRPDARALHYESASREGIDMSLAYNTSRLRLVLKHCETGECLGEFVAAERRALGLIAASGGSQAMAQAYIAAMVTAPGLLRARGVATDEIADVVQAFRQLYLDAAAYDHVMMLRGGVDAAAPAPDLRALREGGEQRAEPLDEFRFRSSRPLIARLREAWFDVAARWALRHLAAQQDARNRRYDEALVRLIDLRQTDGLLAERLAAIEARLDAQRCGGGRGD